MGIVTVFLIAFGLSMDALAVSVSAGMTSRDLSLRNALKMAGFFGGFQAGMPFVGWGAGLLLQSFIAGIDHWVAYGLLSFVGCKVIVGSYASAPGEKRANMHDTPVLLALSLATSIDALAVGITFAFLKVSILVSALIIGAVTFVVCFLGAGAGNKIGQRFGKKIEVLGGLVLIAIGVKILVEHLTQ